MSLYSTRIVRITAIIRARPSASGSLTQKTPYLPLQRVSLSSRLLHGIQLLLGPLLPLLRDARVTDSTSVTTRHQLYIPLAMKESGGFNHRYHSRFQTTSDTTRVLLFLGHLGITQFLQALLGGSFGLVGGVCFWLFIGCQYLF